MKHGVHHYVRLWQRAGVGVRLHRTVYAQAHLAAKRPACPSLVIMDGQSVKRRSEAARAGSTGTSWSGVESELAAGVGAPRAIRPAASACAANRIAVLISCDRALRADGGLGGYRWGLERKRTMLDHERAARAAT